MALTRATREGVHEQDTKSGLESPARAERPEGEEDVARKPTERELEMDRIEAARMAAFEAETGIKQEEWTSPADPIVEETAPVVEAAPAVDALKQAAAQTDGDEIIITAENIGRVKFATKIDGVEELAPASKVVANYQKGGTADVRLAEATRLRNEAKTALDEAKKAAPATPEAPVQTEVKPDNTAVAAKFEAAAQALYEGDSKLYAKLQSEAIAEQTALSTAGRREPATQPAIDTATVVSAVKQQLSQESALAQLDKDYPGLRNDADLSLITNRYIAAIRENDPDISLGAAIAQAADQVGEKFKLGKFAAQGGRPLTSNDAPTTKEQKLAGKEKIDALPSTDARATNTQERELTPSEQIEEMRKSRPGAA